MQKVFLSSILVAASLVLSMLPKSAAAQVYSYIQVDASPGKCLDFADPSSGNYYLQVWNCAGSSAYNQRWYWIEVPGYGNATYMLQNAQFGTCVGVMDNSLDNAARLVQQPCDASNTSQHWMRLTRDAYVQTKSKYMNARSYKCMDIYSTANGTPFQQYTCDSRSYWAPQMFRASLIPSGQ